MNPMLAKNYNKKININGWLMSEKLDGVRALWNGSELLSRNGNKFFAPDWFTDQLPSGIMLDGELYVDRNQFQRTVGIIRKKSPVSAEWQTIRYCVFDAPECKGDFTTRIDFCADILAGCGIAEVVEHTACNGIDHLQDYFYTLIAKGAEGVMLRNPVSGYEQRRSDNLLKYKPIESDEADVIGYQPGEGKHINRLGALVCKWGNVIFCLGTGFTDDMRNYPPHIGSKVTFLYQGLTDGGVPRFPVFLSVRDYE